MRETLYQIKSPTSGGTPYKDWATTGTTIAFTVVYYLHSSYRLKASRFSSLHCTILLFAVKEAKARQIPIGLPQNLKNYFENALRKPPISNIFG